MSVTTLAIILVALIFISGFFSAAEIALMSVNRYKLHHLAKSGNRTARLIKRLLQQPDQLLSVILIVNNFTNIMASAIATMIANNFFGPMGVLGCMVVLTLLILIFFEVMPKTLAVLQPMRLSFYVIWPLAIIKKIVYPLVWLINKPVLGMLRLIGVRIDQSTSEALSADELRTLLHETNHKFSRHDKSMLLGILNLTHATVNDIMIPKNEMVGIDLTNEWEDILLQLTTSQHTRLPVFERSIDQIKGVLNLHNVMGLLAQNNLNKDSLLAIYDEAYYVPATTALSIQLLNFKKSKYSLAVVVNEYGDILGLVTLEDILAEIVGEFTSNYASMVKKEIYPQADGSYLVDGSANLHSLNRDMRWQLPTNGAKTLSGAIIAFLETIPSAQICLRLNGYPLEVVQIKDNMIKTVRIMPALKLSGKSAE